MYQTIAACFNCLRRSATYLQRFCVANIAVPMRLVCKLVTAFVSALHLITYTHTHAHMHRVEQLEKQQGENLERFKIRTKELKTSVAKELQEATLDAAGMLLCHH